MGYSFIPGAARSNLSKRKRKGIPSVIAALVAFTMDCLVPNAGLAVRPSDTLAKGLRLVDSNYLFVSELEGVRLLEKSLNYIALRLPEVRVTGSENGAHILAAGDCRLRVEAPPGTDLPALADVLGTVSSFLDRCVVDRPDELPPNQSLLLAGVLSGLDPYSAVFDAERKTEHTIQFRGKLAGIGARIGIRDEQLTLVTVYKSSPAAKSGLRDGDVVLRVDGHSTTNMPVRDAVERIRGRVGSPVGLEIDREGETEPLLITVTRGLVTIPSVEATLLSNGVVHATITHFSQTTPADFRKRVDEAMGEQEVAGIIIDLRGNSGGSMLGSSAIGDLFLEEGLLITTAGRGGTAVSGLTAQIHATADTPFANLPVIMLTSPRTASGSELLAASLRNNDRAVLLGERTFGKGTVQKTYNLGTDASLKMTVGHFLPNGLSIPGRGLEPDVEVRRFRVAESGILTPPTGHGRDLPFWLQTPEWLNPSSTNSAGVILHFEDLRSDDDNGEAAAADDEPTEVDPETDPAIQLASEVLSKFGSTSAARMLAGASQWLSEQSQIADDRMIAEMDKLGVDWQRPRGISAIESVINPSLQITAVPRTPLKAGEENEIEFTVTNTGERALYRLFANLRSDTRFVRGRGLLFGYVGAGESRSWTVDVIPPKDAHTSRVEMRVEFLNDAGHLAQSGPLYLALSEAGSPRIAHRFEARSGSEDTLVEITVEIENRGDLPAEDVRVFLKHPEGDDLELLDGAATIEQLDPGDTETIVLTARRLRSSAEEQTLDLMVSEPAYRVFLESRVPLTTDGGISEWREPPTIELSGMIQPGDGAEYTIVAEITDDHALATLWSALDGRKVAYLASDSDPRSVRIRLPWQPGDEVQRLEIIATDNDGLTSRYTTDL